MAAPTDVPNLQTWLDWDATYVRDPSDNPITNGQPAAKLFDRSPNAQTWTCLTPTNAPLWNATDGTFNNLPSATWQNLADSGYEHPANTAFHWTGGYTIAVMADFSILSGQKQLFRNRPPGAPPANGFNIAQDGVNFTSMNADDGTNVLTLSANVPVPTAGTLMVARLDDTGITLRYNGVDQGATSSFSIGSAPLGTMNNSVAFGVGHDPTIDRRWRGTMAEWCYWSRPLTNQEINNTVEPYFNGKYLLGMSIPYLAKLGEVMRMDPANSPYTINLPTGLANNSVGLYCKSQDQIDVTLNAAAGDVIYDPTSGLTGNSINTFLSREGVLLTFDGALKQWFPLANAIPETDLEVY